MDAMEETGRQRACEYSWWGQVQLDSGMGRKGLIYRSYRTQIGPIRLR